MSTKLKLKKTKKQTHSKGLKKYYKYKAKRKSKGLTVKQLRKIGALYKLNLPKKWLKTEVEKVVMNAITQEQANLEDEESYGTDDEANFVTYATDPGVTGGTDGSQSEESVESTEENVENVGEEEKSESLLEEEEQNVEKGAERVANKLEEISSVDNQAQVVNSVRPVVRQVIPDRNTTGLGATREDISIHVSNKKRRENSISSFKEMMIFENKVPFQQINKLRKMANPGNSYSISPLNPNIVYDPNPIWTMQRRKNPKLVNLIPDNSFSSNQSITTYKPPNPNKGLVLPSYPDPTLLPKEEVENYKRKLFDSETAGERTGSGNINLAPAGYYENYY